MFDNLTGRNVLMYNGGVKKEQPEKILIRDMKGLLYEFERQDGVRIIDPEYVDYIEGHGAN